MDRLRRLAVLPALTALALASGCAGPPIPAPIEGIPVCTDFESGGTKMAGGLRYPVRLRVLEGKTVLFKTVITGRRSADEPPPYSFIADDNLKLTVEWAQCSNEHAPRVATPHKKTKSKERPRDDEGTSYECGEANVYKADGVLQTRKGDASSHVITFVPPPNAACWAGQAPAPAATADAGAPDAAVPSEDAGVSDAGAAATDAGATAAGDAGAAATDAGAAPADAGAKK
jgi:hypothetical protein